MAAILVVASLLVPINGADVATEAPVGDSVCLVCNGNADCESYADYSICLRGQCTSDRGLFGQGCKCQGDEDCATGRCDGIFQQTCRPRRNNGALCNENSDCKSEICNTAFLCAEPETRDNDNDTEPNTVELPEVPAAAESLGTHEPTESASTTAPDLSFNDLISCKECEVDSECGQGFCVDSLCTDPTGVHPPFCVKCVADQECTTGYFCDADGMVGKTGRKCAAKKQSGKSCNRREECRSNHCNILWRCESTVPDQKRNSTRTSDSEWEAGLDWGGILIWVAIAGVLIAFGVGSFVFCRRDGFNRTFCQPKGIVSTEADKPIV